MAHPEALPWLLTTPLFLRDAESGADLRRIVDAVRSRMGVGLLPNVLFHVARDQATSTAWSRATANYEEGIRLARETGQGTDLAMSLAGLAWLESRQGRGDACRGHASEAVGLCTERGIRMGEVWCLFALGDLQLAEGDARAATATFLDLSGGWMSGASPTPTSPPSPSWWTRSSGSAAPPTRRPRRLDTRPLHGEGAALVVGPGTPGRRPGGRRRVVRRALRRRARGHVDTRDLFEAARTHLAYGGRLRRAARRVDARVHLRSALESFEELGAELWARTAAAELEATGETVPGGRPPAQTR